MTSAEPALRVFQHTLKAVNTAATISILLPTFWGCNCHVSSGVTCSCVSIFSLHPPFINFLHFLSRPHNFAFHLGSTPNRKPRRSSVYPPLGVVIDLRNWNSQEAQWNTSHDQPSHNCANCLRTTHPQSSEGTCCPNRARAVRADNYTLHTVYELMCLCMYFVTRIKQ